MNSKLSQKQYTCPMHPEITQNTPGMCSECGMNLISIKQKKHNAHSTGAFLRKFWVSLILTLLVVLYPNAGYLPFVLGSVVFFYGGWVFLAGAYRELKAALPGMMTLIGIAVSAAYLWSVYATFAGAETLFWELTTLITIMLLGHYLEMRAVSGAQGALKELSKLLPDIAEIIKNGKTEIIQLSQLREGDTVIIRPGGRVPSDGVVVEGKSEINESMVTGESAPVDKNLKSEVIAGTVNGDGLLKIKITKVGEHTFLAGIMRLVAEAQASKSRLQILSDRAAFYLTIIAVAGGLATFFAWLFAGAQIGFAVARLVAVLVVACPHALGLAVPLVASISTTKAAQNGFLVKRRLSLEAARKIDIVLFDKTGTLTKGEFGVMEAEDETLRLAASVDAYSEHFVARAIVKEAKNRGLAVSEVKNFERIPGKGVRGSVEGKKISVESSNFENGPYTAVEVWQENKSLGKILLADAVRPESREAVQALKKLGVKVAMISGDSEKAASWAADELGIKEYFARVLPGQKSEKVKLLQSRNLKVAMVGDGINDAPALMRADLGIAIGAGTNIAIESAGIILVKSDPRDIVKIIKLSRLTYRKMFQNIFWATGYNVVALPLAAGALVSYGIILSPATAAVLMSLSTIIVAINAILLKRSNLN